MTKPVDRIELLARVRSLVSLKAFTDELERAESVLFTLAPSIEGKDPYTEGHCQRLADYSVHLDQLRKDCVKSQLDAEPGRLLSYFGARYHSGE